MEPGTNSSALHAAMLLAAAQHGIVLSTQFRAAGVSRRTEARMARDGVLTPVRPGAFAVAGAPVTAWQEAMAVVLLAGPGAVLSHSSAARLHRIPGILMDGVPEVTVVRPRHPRVPDARVHRIRDLRPSDATDKRGIRVTTPVRTLIDVAPRLGLGVLARSVDEGLIAGLWTVAELQAGVEINRRRKGVSSLDTVLRGWTFEDRAASHLEQRVARVLDCFRPFELQHQVAAGREVYVLDLAWPAVQVGVEDDGWLVRGRSRQKFHHDRRRGNALAGIGWTIVHLTADMSDDEMRTAVGSVLMPALAASGASGA